MKKVENPFSKGLIYLPLKITLRLTHPSKSSNHPHPLFPHADTFLIPHPLLNGWDFNILAPLLYLVFNAFSRNFAVMTVSKARRFIRSS